MSRPAVLPLRDASFWQDPYPVLRAAREQHRTAVTERGELALLTADDVELASNHPALVPLGLEALDRLGIRDGPFREWRALSLNAQRGADHERLRKLVGKAFSPRQAERVRPTVRERAHELIDAHAARGEMDAVHDFAPDLPLFGICAFLGLPAEDRREIDGFIVGTEEGFSYPMTDEKRARVEGGIVALYAYVRELIERRRIEPLDDLISALVGAEEAGDRLSEPELLAMVVNIIGGALGSTRAALSNGAYLLATHPEQAAALRRDPARVRATVEEVLRYAPPFRSSQRMALEPVRIGDAALETGQSVYLSRQAANRDPARFAEPDRFDIARSEDRHVTFGYGPHFCLGQALARAVLQESLGVLVQRCSKLDALVDPPERVPFSPDERLVAMPLALTAEPGAGTRSLS